MWHRLGTFLRPVRKLRRCTSGATAIEYGLIVSLIVIAMMPALVAVAGSTITIWNDVSNKMSNATPSS